MKWKAKLSKWKLDSLKLNLRYAEAEFTYAEFDEMAAWEMYVELITRITTRPLPLGEGDEKAALDSVYSLFPTTRALLKTYGRKGQTFSKLAVVVLNQVIRPFTTKWHGVAIAGFQNGPAIAAFRSELTDLQVVLASYAAALSEIAGVEDISDIDALPTG